jgi:serine/threonine protein phosphatase 1
VSFTYAIADLHGRHDLLVKAEQAIVRYAGGAGGIIVTLGDYVDRGPESRQIVERLMLPVASPFYRICLKGNHEDMMVETLRKPLQPFWWIANGGAATLISYGHPVSEHFRPEVVPQSHIEWMARLPLMHVDQHRVFVHGGVDPTLSLKEQPDKVLLSKLYPIGANLGHGHRHVVHGHHQFADGPLCFSCRTDLDTFAWYTGRLVVGVFDDDSPGGPIDFIEVNGPRAVRVRIGA